MKVQQFLAHHGIAENPFGQEDAQSDHVFLKHCVSGTHHPAWDKIFGQPDNPSTAVVFGEKGSGKTALRLQIIKYLDEYNRKNADRRAFVVEYDDFNPFLDAFCERLPQRKRRPERAIPLLRLWDHMDAILSLAVTKLVRSITQPNGDDQAIHPTIPPESLDRLTSLQKRDLLMLAAFYNHSPDLPVKQSWNRLRRLLKFPVWRAEWDRGLGIAATVLTIGLVLYFGQQFTDLFQWWVGLIILIGWLPWLSRQAGLFWKSWRISKQIRVFDHLPNTLRKLLAHFQRQELADQPIPDKDRSDDRYKLLTKLQSILNTLGFGSMIVLIDRVDEPHLINGSPERMRDLLWPMFDNKFLKHPGLGFKLLLPAEVSYYLNREEKEFYERSRLDKQNLIPSLQWSGESLYDIANDRLRGCAADPDQQATLRNLFDESIDRDELIGIFSRLRVPRHLFKFLYRLLVEHCNRYTDEHPNWKINRETTQSTLALYLRDLEAFDRGLGVT